MSRAALLCIFILSTSGLMSQHLLTDDPDTTALNSRRLKMISEKYGNLSFSGYMQPQFQIATKKGIVNEFEGGAFDHNVSNRFRLRRGRLKAEYLTYHKDQSPETYFIFQFDGSEKGVNIRDFWGRYYENKWKLFSFSMGIMGRPFGYELQLSSSTRESPERGRMSQTLMKTERDLGALISINKRSSTNIMKKIQLDVGLYNGQGLSGPGEFDNVKDIVSRLSIKPMGIGKLQQWSIQGGISSIYGGIENRSPYLYETVNIAGQIRMSSDSIVGNVGKKAPRIYGGIDAEIASKSLKWKTQLRAEYIFGRQSSTKYSSYTPGSYPVSGGISQPLYIRSFNGAYFYLIQNIMSAKNQLVLKYDWYDPNTKIEGKGILENSGFTDADIMFATVGVGLIHQVNRNLKLMAYYSHPMNESSGITNYTSDIDDDIFTLRTQFMF